MKQSVLEIIQVSLGMMFFFKKRILPKPIHFIAITFFTLLVVYATSSLLPIIGECADVVKNHMNLDAIRF